MLLFHRMVRHGDVATVAIQLPSDRWINTDRGRARRSTRREAFWCVRVSASQCAIASTCVQHRHAEAMGPRASDVMRWPRKGPDGAFDVVDGIRGGRGACHAHDGGLIPGRGGGPDQFNRQLLLPASHVVVCTRLALPLVCGVKTFATLLS